MGESCTLSLGGTKKVLDPQLSNVVALSARGGGGGGFQVAVNF